MMKWVFENGYRRYEWKCNAENLRSRKSAQRLGHLMRECLGKCQLASAKTEILPGLQ